MIGRVVLILVLQTVVLGAMVGMKQWTLSTGRPVILETEPIDPRSLFRGDYVQLGYAISRIDVESIEGDDEFEQYGDIFVVLEESDKYWRPRSIHRQYPSVDDDLVVIKGEVTGANLPIFDEPSGELRPSSLVLARYGIENYFVPEGEGRELESLDAGRIDIQVVVDLAGNAAIRSVIVDGEVRHVETLL